MTTFWKETLILATLGSLVYDIFGALRSKIQNVPLHPKFSPAVYGKNGGVNPPIVHFSFVSFLALFGKIHNETPQYTRKGDRG